MSNQPGNIRQKSAKQDNYFSFSIHLDYEPHLRSIAKSPGDAAGKYCQLVSISRNSMLLCVSLDYFFFWIRQTIIK